MPRAMRRLCIVALALGLLGSPPGARGQESRLIPIQRAAPHTRTGPPSQRDARPHLKLGTPAGLRSRPAFAKAGLLSGPALPDTLRVLVLRISFPADEDPLTTGTGSFDLRDLATFQAEEGHDIDAAPHDRGYAERHMLALHHYWWANSGGALSIESQVLPDAATASYLMPHEMAYYGFESPLGDIIGALEALISDAVAAADGGSDPVDWTAWDAFVIFHAGADWQGDVSAAGDTPADIPSAYIALDSPVSVGGREIWDATVVPETVSQDGFVGGVNGVFAHEFGHQLGLPDLYDTTSGETAVGLFALMDLGDFTGGLIGDLFVQGILPAGLSPWTRMYMGWVTPEEIWPGAGQTLEVVAPGAVDGVHAAPAGPRLALVHAAEHQAFLVEYRPDDLDGDSTISLNWNQGVIDGTARLEGTDKVLTYEYDALLPGSGVLIWHLDEEVALRDGDGDGYDDLAGNTLQADRYRRFLDLEEADGLQQLGFLPGYLGEEEDYWQPLFGGGAAPLAFGPDGEPSTDSWTGAPTGISVVVRAGSDPLSASIQVSSERTPAWKVGIPATDPDVSIPWYIEPASADPFIALLDGNGGLWLWDPAGQPYAGPNPVWTAPSPVHCPPTWAADVLAVAAEDSLHFLDRTGAQVASFALPAPPRRRPLATPEAVPATVLLELDGGIVLLAGPGGAVASGILSAPMGAAASLPGGRLVGVSAGSVVELVPVGSTLQPTVLGDLGTTVTDMLVGERRSPDGGDPADWTAAAVTSEGNLLFFERGMLGSAPGIRTLRTHGIAPVTGELALAGRGNAGPNNVVVPTARGPMAFDFVGQPVADWPPGPGGRAVAPAPVLGGTPLVFGYDNAQPVLLGLTSSDEVAAYDHRARAIPGARWQFPGSPAVPPTLGLDTLDKPLLLVVEEDSLRAESLRWIDQVPEAWSLVWAGPQGGAAGRSAGDSGFSSLIIAPPGPPSWDWTLEGFYTYPNPVRDRCWIRAEALTGELTVYAYTVAGTPLGEVARFEAGSRSQRQTVESAWDVSHLAPGAYLLVGVHRTPWHNRTGRVTAKVLVVR